MQVRFNNEGCFIEKDGRLIAKGRRDGRLFILDSNEVKSSVHTSDSDDSAHSLDSEFGVPIMRKPGVKKVLTTTNEKLRRSSQAKTQVTRYTYNEYMVHQYALAMKVAAKQEPERPNLHQRLEGENRPNRNWPDRGKEIREEPRNKAAKSVEYKCIMHVFTLSPWIALV